MIKSTLNLSYNFTVSPAIFMEKNRQVMEETVACNDYAVTLNIYTGTLYIQYHYLQIYLSYTTTALSYYRASFMLSGVMSKRFLTFCFQQHFRLYFCKFTCCDVQVLVIRILRNRKGWIKINTILGKHLLAYDEFVYQSRHSLKVN